MPKMIFSRKFISRYISMVCEIVNACICERSVKGSSQCQFTECKGVYNGVVFLFGTGPTLARDFPAGGAKAVSGIS